MIRSLRSRTVRVLGLALAGLAFAGLNPASAQKVAFTATLDGAQEIPPVATPARGTAVLLFDLDANTITYRITVHGLSSPEIDAHYHGFAPPGVSGGILFGLPLGKTKSGVLGYLDADEQNYLANLSYLNIHTVNFPGGEVRGQVVRANADATLFLALDGAQEVPPVPTPATGTAFMKINRATNTIDYGMTFTDLSAAQTAAHIHGFAPPGSNAGVKISLPMGNHVNGSGIYPEADENNYLAGLSYINVHSMNFTGGEIRGQALLQATDPTTYCTALVSSSGCTPSMVSSGQPSLASPGAFSAGATNLEMGQNGLLFFGTTGPNASPFFGGTLCVSPQLFRMNVKNAGGAAACSGAMSYTLADMLAHPSGGSLLLAEQIVNCQVWTRDPPAPTTVSLSNGLQFTVRL